HIQARPLRYYPASLTVMPGETVLFKVTNDATTFHEFVLGDQKAQTDYQKVMDGMGTAPMAMPDRSNILNLNAGVTKQLAWTFPNASNLTVLYGSHEPGDYSGGLQGTITVTPNAATTPTSMADTSTSMGTGGTSTTMGGTSTTMGGTPTTMGDMTSTTMNMGSMPMGTTTTVKP
ncbi:MAG: hypothetical protein M3N98_07390, partial [Actinomycetota bacterium]|nr:hypothetical protein [Actinomycetota bacterium]